MVDTNCDPRSIDYVIPSNDDAIRAIKLMVGKIADAALEGLGSRKDEIIEEEVRTIARAAVDERELTDEELLGEATLAKLTPRLKAIEEELVEDLLIETEQADADFELDAEEMEEFEAVEVAEETVETLAEETGAGETEAVAEATESEAAEATTAEAEAAETEVAEAANEEENI
jgi:hypothetical protein